MRTLIHPLLAASPDSPVACRFLPRIDEDSLLFHTLRDSNVIIINDGKTAHRLNAFKYFNNGIVMTNRTLRTNELFQVRIDLVIPKWAGSIEIGVTQHSSNDIQFPFKMSNAKSGTWAVTGEDVIRDGVIIIPQYVRNLNKLVEGETVGVLRNDLGILHVYINGADQGPAAFNVPENVYGIVDLYGRAAQATIVDNYSPPPLYSPESPLSTESNATIFPEMCFHRVHGRNARLSRNRLTAWRATVYSEFNDAVLFSSRPLRECDMFELRIDKMVDCWIGSLRNCRHSYRPQPGTTYILSGTAMMKDGECVRSGYPLDLDTLTVGSRVGMMWHADRSLHYYLDGMDMGKAWYVPHLNIYAVVDLYGQCTQVTILQNEERAFNYNGCTNSGQFSFKSFSEYCGDNICLMHDYSIAKRLTPDPMATLVFSSAHLALEEIFEITIAECKSGYAGTFRIGVTDINILNAHVNRSLPPSVSCLPHFTAYIDGRSMKYSKPGTREQDVMTFVPSFEWLRTGDRVGLKKTSDSRVLVYYNSEELDLAFENVPDKVYVVMELFGHVTKIQAVNQGNVVVTAAMLEQTLPTCVLLPTRHHHTEPSIDAKEEPIREVSQELQQENEGGEVAGDASEVPLEKPVTEGGETALEIRRRRNNLPYTFYYIHGDNIRLCSSDTVAVRYKGYQQGIAVVSQPLRRGHNFRFRVDKLDYDWCGTAGIGAVGVLPIELPMSAIHLETPCWILTSDLLNDNGVFTISLMEWRLITWLNSPVLTIHFRFNSELVLEIDGKIIGAIGVVPRRFSHIFPTIDLYGRIAQVSVLLHPYVVTSGASLDLPIITENLCEDEFAEQELFDGDKEPVPAVEEIASALELSRPKKKPKAYSQENLIEERLPPINIEAGPSTKPDPVPEPSSSSAADTKIKEVKCRKQYPNRTSLHHSLILSENPLPANNNEMVNRCIQKSHSTHSFCQIPDENEGNGLRHTFSVGSHVGDDTDRVIHENFCDTNIRHNDRYPEGQ
ncbi:unnamed protein product [Arctia plantaginis]|uniref:NHR domain-containing protein n=1 Tax=Arctia plantaginis TaxID=874455 RepID=A0A8S1AYP1_ARCPL|nr:unnamed protein product [Arctia plantaginis]